MEAYIKHFPTTVNGFKILCELYGGSNVRISHVRTGDSEFVIERDASSPINRDPLEVVDGMDVNKSDLDALATELLKYICSDYDEVADEIINQNYIPMSEEQLASLGAHTRLWQSYDKLWKVDRGERHSVLANEILPELLKVLPDISRVVPVRMSQSSKQQGLYSLLKACSAFEMYGKNINTLEDYIDKKEMYSGVEMSAGAPFLSMLQAYTSFTPIFFTVPYTFMGVSWNFISKAPLIIGSMYTSSFMSLLQSTMYPMQDDGMPGILIDDACGESFSIDLLEFSVECLNEVLSYGNDIFNFLNDQGEVETLKQLQFLGGVHLLFSDVSSMNHTTHSHIRHYLAFGAIEKIANIVWALAKVKKRNVKGYPLNISGNEISETKIINTLLSMDMCELIIDLMERKLGGSKNKVQQGLVGACRKAYQKFHLGLDEMFPNVNVEEKMKRFRSFRNAYSHGAFLGKDQFEEVFYTSKGVIPKYIMVIPYFLLFALSSDVDVFLSKIAQVIEA